MYLGLFVGFANNIIFPRFIGEEVLGFTIWLTEIAGFPDFACWFWWKYFHHSFFSLFQR